MFPLAFESWTPNAKKRTFIGRADGGNRLARVFAAHSANVSGFDCKTIAVYKRGWTVSRSISFSLIDLCHYYSDNVAAACYTRVPGDYSIPGDLRARRILI